MQYVVIGKIGKTYGVHGWVNIHSYTVPKDGIFKYKSWKIRIKGNWQPLEITDSRKHGSGFIVHMQGCDAPEQAKMYVDAEIGVLRDQLPEIADEDSYYWSDLQGMSVVTELGVNLGTVEYLFATGSNDVLVVKGEREHLIPYIPKQVIRKVDLQNKMIEVIWDPEF